MIPLLTASLVTALLDTFGAIGRARRSVVVLGEPDQQRSGVAATHTLDHFPSKGALAEVS